MTVADIVAIGVVVPNGLSARQAVFFTRAGRLFARESPFVDRRGAPVGLASVTAIPDEVRGPARLVALAAPALAECLGHVAGPLPLVLATGSPPDAGVGAAFGASAGQEADKALLAALAETTNGRIDRTRSLVAHFGRAGGAVALSVAASRLRQRQAPFVLLGGVDSHHDADRLEALDDAHRLHAEDVENGFLPGEGAAFLLLGPPGGPDALARIRSVAVEHEPRSLESTSGEPCQGLAMTLAIGRALDDAGLPRVTRVVSDVVEERHRVSEWLLASGRLAARLSDSPRHEQPLLITGELGAASLPFLAAYVAGLYRADAQDEGRAAAVLLVSSDGEERAAVVVTPP